MAAKNYDGRCGSCLYLQLDMGLTTFYGTFFYCFRVRDRVRADGKPCWKYEYSPFKTRELVERFDR